MRVKLIARVSTDHQDADIRMNELRTYAKNNNYLIVGEYWIYESATIDLEDRKEFINALNENKNEDLVIINKLDRITRNFKSISWFEDFFTNHKAKLVALDFIPDFKTAIGRFLFRQILTIACLEAEQMKERQIAGIKKAKEAGKFKGRQKGAKSKIKTNKIELLNTSSTNDNDLSDINKVLNGSNSRKSLNKIENRGI